MNYNRYRILDGEYIFNTFEKGQRFNNEIWLEDDGSFEDIKALYYANILKSRDNNILLNKLIVVSNTVPFDANNTSIGYMSSVLSIANFKFNQLVVSGTSNTDAYEVVYKTIIDWKNADNTISKVQLETVAEALELAMTEVGRIKTE